MEFKTIWEEGMVFNSKIGGHTITMDSQYPLGHDQGANPKELFLASLAGCIGMDVVGLLKKYKQKISHFMIESKARQSQEGYPIVFTAIDLVIRIDGEVNEAMALEAVELASSRYCGISKMLSSSVPIQWIVVLNGRHVGVREAKEFLSSE